LKKRQKCKFQILPRYWPDVVIKQAKFREGCSNLLAAHSGLYDCGFAGGLTESAFRLIKVLVRPLIFGLNADSRRLLPQTWPDLEIKKLCTDLEQLKAIRIASPIN